MHCILATKSIQPADSGGASNEYIRELTRLTNSWSERSPLRAVAMKAMSIMPALLLQNTSKNSKSKDYTKALERRLKNWRSGNLLDLFDEAKIIQSRLPKLFDKKDINTKSKLFSKRR